jgi:hypothetical protein
METLTSPSSPAVVAFRDRVAAMRDSIAFRNYSRARDRALEMRAAGEASGEYRPSGYWREELRRLEYLLDASPLVVDTLREHTFHVTGLRVYDYRVQRRRYREQLAEKLRELRRVAAPGLFVPEWPALGGFGFEIDGELVNVDTLKFFEVLIALEKGAVLQEFRGNADRRLVWEIGAGWGGFAYQFKTLCPNVTYLITDLPELFVLSATYLTTAFPEAKVCFWGEEPIERTFEHWRDYDFIFMPHTALPALTPDRLDLAINMVSFQEMTQEQVTNYVSRAHALNCRLLYSLNRDRSQYNPELESVSAIVSRFYWPHEVPVLDVPYTKWIGDTPSDKDYKHIVGWRRAKL